MLIAIINEPTAHNYTHTYIDVHVDDSFPWFLELTYHGTRVQVLWSIQQIVYVTGRFATAGPI